MRIYVDADACPVVRIVEETAKKYSVSCDVALRYESCIEVRV